MSARDTPAHSRPRTLDGQLRVEQRRHCQRPQRQRPSTRRPRLHHGRGDALIGLVLGIVVATRPSKADSKHAIWIIGLSIIASIVWLLVFSSGVLTSTSNDLS